MPKNSRRDNGEGSKPFQRKDGRWQISLRVSNTTTGQPIRKTFTKQTRAAVVAAAKQYRNNLANGVLADPSRTTLESWCTHWIQNIARPGKETTWYSYRNTLNKWVIGSREGQIPLEKLTPVHLERIQARMREAGRAEATILNMHHIVSKALSDAVDRGALGSNPAQRAATPKAAAFNPQVISPTKARELIRAASQDSLWGPSWIVALAFGLRQGERLGLCWPDLDVSSQMLHIRRSLTSLPWKHGPRCGCAAGVRPSACPARTGGGYVMTEPKTARSHRSWRVPDPMMEVFEAQRSLQERWRAEDGPESWVGFTDYEGASWDLMFSQRNGRPINNKTDRAAWKAFTRAHGIEGMRVHDARHTSATILLELGVAPRVVMEMMGWSQMSMLTRYQHVMDPVKHSVSEQVGEALFSGEVPPVTPPDPSEGVVSLDAFRARRSM